MAFDDSTYSATVRPDGTATIATSARGGQRWTVYQISIEGPSGVDPATARGVVRKNGILVSEFLPSGDVVAGDPPLPLGPSDRLTIEWTGCPPGATVTAMLLYSRE